MSTSIEQAEADLASAKQEYHNELEADSQRSDGSVRQERLRENRQTALLERVQKCERSLEEARRHQKAD
ncbi:hypothetical protein AWH63_10560 [Marinobacter sp. C18]|uniref:hypothetical protein n=1 Tax=Marinobacter sp. C18 TaxID=1772288 RepID=UPI0009491D54|nr:hypothetical protein [Marinobacter sp. C18]OLF81972.1 hypothetical protein AWH63_10560 [Marinobacter sp. C18]